MVKRITIFFFSFFFDLMDCNNTEIVNRIIFEMKNLSFSPIEKDQIKNNL